MVDSSPIVSGTILAIDSAKSSPIVLSALVSIGNPSSPVLFGRLEAIGTASSPLYTGNLPGPNESVEV
jgi:hypothetical protein